MPELDLDLWLRPEDVEPETTITFMDSGEQGEIPAEEGKEAVPTFEIGVMLPDGRKRKWTMNKTSQRAIAQAYGTNTDSWINKTADLYVSTANVMGTMKKVIYARVPSGTL